VDLPGPLGPLGKRIKVGPLGPVTDVPFNLKTLYEAGVVRPVRPDKLARSVRELIRYGASPAAGIASAAINHGKEIALIDEAGELTFADLHLRSNALANALADEGIEPGHGVAIMARNHRNFVDATLAIAKLGANALYLNTMFSGPQLEGVMEREKPVGLIYDEEFTKLLSDAEEGADADVGKRFVAWNDGASDHTTIDELIEAGSDSSPSSPAEPSRFIILTSGTTGAPKGAQRSAPDHLGPLAAMFSKIPLHAREKTVIAAPLFHSWGFAHFQLGLALNSTYVLKRKFDPEETLKAIAEHEATALVVVPVMMQRILQLPQETLDKYELPSLRVTAASGSALPGPLAEKWMDQFGENLFNLYGSTEVAWATIATPEDLRAAPGTAGKPPRGTVVKIVDEKGEGEVPSGETGRVFVGNDMAFEGYTGGGGKDEYMGLLSSGDVGHFDHEGRLFIDGRDDEMIVSGGENVFPREVEDLISGHDAVKEVAVIGVEDEEWGQRLKAFVVLGEGEVDADEVKKLVKSNLAGYKVPRDVEFLDSLPRNATGKVLKRELT
jgi:acyl-CoA synthetase (AMP-forming)/AMP-acid ligase II